MRVLDLGCGTGNELSRNGVGPNDSVVGLEKVLSRASQAAAKYPQRSFVCGAGETLPFSQESFDRVVCRLALPYMDIPTVLDEVHRVLKPGGSFFASLHTPIFTLRELKRALSSPKSLLFRLYVLCNGCVFHMTGRPMQLSRRFESFQTDRGMRIAMARAGFNWKCVEASADRFVIEARKRDPAGVFQEDQKREVLV